MRDTTKQHDQLRLFHELVETQTTRDHVDDSGVLFGGRLGLAGSSPIIIASVIPNGCADGRSSFHAGGGGNDDRR